jgi:hypothetical protein
MPKDSCLLACEVAKSFSRLLHGDLGPTKMAVVLERNRAEESKGVCHSHDFCDANMTMLDAMKEHGLMQDEGVSLGDQDTDTWNEAWDIAKRAEFVVDACRASSK